MFPTTIAVGRDHSPYIQTEFQGGERYYLPCVERGFMDEEGLFSLHSKVQYGKTLFSLHSKGIYLESFISKDSWGAKEVLFSLFSKEDS